MEDVDTLRSKIVTSTMNLKQIQTGKRVIAVFATEQSKLTDQSIKRSPTQQVNEGLKVFENQAYARDLRSLLNCEDLDNSFNVARFSPRFDNIAGALITA